MTRTRVNGKSCRKPSNPQMEPDFYELPTIPSAEAISSSDEVSLVEEPGHHLRGNNE
jgi:hypothetical protein